MFEIAHINGSTLIFSPFANIETASLGVFIKGGSRYEPIHTRGISHFLEHMLFKGSKKYSYKQIKQEIEGRGGALNGFTAQEITGYYAHFLKKNLAPTLDILLDMVCSPLLLANEIQKERNVILEEIKMYNDLPSARVGMLLDKMLWSGHPLGEEIIGEAETVKAITRSDLDEWQKRFYQPSHMVISCAGNFDPEEIKELLVRKIQGPVRSAEIAVKKPAPLSGFHAAVEAKKLEQAHFCIGFRGVTQTSPEKFIVELIHVILGANMSSRLFEEIREKRALCYEVSTEVRKFRDTGGFIIHTGLDKRNIDVALARTLVELKKIKTREVGNKELSRAKDYLLGQIAMGLERPQGMMFYTAESFVSLGKIYEFAQIKKEIEKIEPCDIKRVAQSIFSFGDMCISCIVDDEKGVREKIEKVVAPYRHGA